MTHNQIEIFASLLKPSIQKRPNRIDYDVENFRLFLHVPYPDDDVDPLVGFVVTLLSNTPLVGGD